MNLRNLALLAVPMVWMGIQQTLSQNPIISGQYTADPTARVFGERVFLYPSHDILAVEGRGRPGWFCMEDYHVFSSDNLSDWTDHGVIVSQYDVDWVARETFSMWAPDAILRNGKYYFYFPAIIGDTVKYGRGFSVGVAVADAPEGPYTPEPAPIKDLRGIDPNVFIDKDGQAYLYWSLRHLFAAKLKENMMELDSEPVILGELPEEGLKEGPFLFERNGIYYLTYPHVENRTERLEYAMGDNPLGPFKVTGVIMDESPTGCWTNHHSIINFRGQWYLFYHHNDYSPNFDKNRSARIDSLFFNEDGTIQKVVPTLRGVGVTDASEKIQIDRYSMIGDGGTSIEFLDTLDWFQGWKTIFEEGNGWIRYNSVDFGKGDLKTVAVKTFSPGGGMLEIRTASTDGPVIAKIAIPASGQWNTISAPLSSVQPGIQDLFVRSLKDTRVEVDWIQFE